jgi:hypothetical protein
LDLLDLLLLPKMLLVFLCIPSYSKYGWLHFIYWLSCIGLVPHIPRDRQKSHH